MTSLHIATSLAQGHNHIYIYWLEEDIGAQHSVIFPAVTQVLYTPICITVFDLEYNHLPSHLTHFNEYIFHCCPRIANALASQLYISAVWFFFIFRLANIFCMTNFNSKPSLKASLSSARIGISRQMHATGTFHNKWRTDKTSWIYYKHNTTAIPE